MKSGLAILLKSKVLSHFVAYVKSDLIIKFAPLYPTVCIFTIETINWESLLKSRAVILVSLPSVVLFTNWSPTIYVYTLAICSVVYVLLTMVDTRGHIMWTHVDHTTRWLLINTFVCGVVCVELITFQGLLDSLIRGLPSSWLFMVVIPFNFMQQ